MVKNVSMQSLYHIYVFIEIKSVIFKTFRIIRF